MTVQIECCDIEMVKQVTNLLEKKGYRYGCSGRVYERRAAHNMRYIHVDTETGFYRGFKSKQLGVEWLYISSNNLYVLKRLPDIKAVHEKARKNDRPVDNHMRAPSQDGRKMERMWYTVTGRAMGISRMNDDHLHNTILLVDRTIAEGGDRVGNNTDLAGLLNELEDERIHRGLHLPLVPFISLEYRKENF